jgi:conjugative transfer region protein (TIGR03750 family)
MNNETDFLVNRLNFDPVVYKGCTEKEIMLVVFVIALPLCFLLGVMGYVMWRNIFFGILIGGVLSLLVVFIALRVIERLKRDKEPGFLQQALMFKLEQKGILKTPIIRRTGSWTIGRFVK